MSSRQLAILLATPAKFRPLSAAGTISSHARRLVASPSRLASFSTTGGRSAAPRHTKPAAFRIPEYSSSAPVDLTPAQLFEHSSLLHTPNEPLEDGLTTLFTKNPATFYYGNPDFYHLRKNTRTPEVCILGRSNVGKSSLVNAVANRMGSELARVSKKAGHTKTINAYGFGPAPRPEKGEVVLSDEFKGKEEMPKHMFFLVDMPGYGHGSLQEWGKNIALYLQKRTALKGAVMLIDAEVGPKESDWDAIELMANAGLRTAIVLTKADKVKSGNEGLLKTCRKVWDGIRRIESQLAESNKKWTWEKEFYVTASGANDAAVRRATIATARLAVARLAGLVKDTRPQAVEEQKWSGKIVSFDELFGTTSGENPETSSHPEDQQAEAAIEPDEWDELEDPAEGGFVEEYDDRHLAAAFESKMRNSRHREPEFTRKTKSSASSRSPSHRKTKNANMTPKRQSRSDTKHRRTPPQSPRGHPNPFDKLEAASRPTLGGRNSFNRSPPKASFFHTYSGRHAPSPPASENPPTSLSKEELNGVLADFIKTLQPSNTLRDIVRQRQLDMERGVGQPDSEALKQSWADRLERNKKQLAKRHKQQTKRIREIRDRRLALEEEKLQRQEEMLAEQARLARDTDWVAIRREMRQLEREKKAEEAALAAAALEESRRIARENGAIEPDEEGRDQEELGQYEADVEEDSLYRKNHRQMRDQQFDLAELQGKKKGKGKKGKKEMDEFERVFASKLAGSGSGSGKGDKDKFRPSF